MSRNFIYTWKDLTNDITGVADEKHEGKGSKEDNIPPRLPIELPHLLNYLANSENIARENEDVKSFLPMHLFCYSFFISSQPDYHYNKGYLNSHIIKFEKFINSARSFFQNAIKHFNELIREIPSEIIEDKTIGYNGFLRFKHEKMGPGWKWKANIHTSNLANLARVEPDKVMLELLGENEKTLLAMPIIMKKEKFQIDEIIGIISRLPCENE